MRGARDRWAKHLAENCKSNALPKQRSSPSDRHGAQQRGLCAAGFLTEKRCRIRWIEFGPMTGPITSCDWTMPKFSACRSCNFRTESGSSAFGPRACRASGMGYAARARYDVRSRRGAGFCRGFMRLRRPACGDRNDAVGGQGIVVADREYMVPTAFPAPSLPRRRQSRRFGIEILLLRETIGRKSERGSTSTNSEITFWQTAWRMP